MSKKLAEGIDGLVLDVKVGAGAFMKDVARARALCAAMRAIGVGAGKRVTCVLTDMDAPIGTHVGNALEIAESIEVMRGGGPADTRELTVVLGAEMLLLAGVERDPDAAAARIGKSLDDGSALAVFAKIVAAQGGDPRVCDAPAQVLPQPRRKVPIVAPRAGHVAAMVADEIGMAALVLGAGRGKQDDRIDPAVGLVLAVRPGDRVAAGDLIATAWCDDDDARLDACRARVLGAVQLVDHAVPPPPASRVIETIR
jgi:pyrimidine-nucleoside phosphorylase